jgi:hypothetical protein
MSKDISQVRVLDLVKEALEGNATHIDELRLASHEQLQLAGQALGGQLRFGRPTVLRVLKDWRDGRLVDEQVRWWALLMFIGAFPEEWSPKGWKVHFSAQPIDFDYSDDEDVNEIVFQLKEIGAVDDGGAIKYRVNAMIMRLDFD